MDRNEIPGIMGRPMYYAPNGEPVSLDMAEQLLEEADSRTIGRDLVISADNHEVAVSTVFLVVDHSPFDGPPVLWETIIFGHPDEPMWRYTSLADATRGHNDICGLLRVYGLDMDQWPEPEE